MTGRLWGVGVGPGDPELITVKAARLIGAADVVAYHSARHGRSNARRTAEPYLRAGQVEEQLIYPVTVETTDHPGGYRAAMDEFYAAAAARLAAHLDAGRDVVVLSEGDPFFYGSYMHLHERLAHRYPTEVVAGVTSVSAAAAALGRPLVERDEVLTVLPGTLPAEELARRLADTDAAAVLKLGRTFTGVRTAAERAGVLDELHYVERASMAEQRIASAADVDPATVPYFSVALLPSRLAAATTAREAARGTSPDPPGTSVGLTGTSADLTGTSVDPIGTSADPIGTSPDLIGTSVDASGSSPAPGADPGLDPDTGARPSTPGEVVVVGLGPAGRPWLTPEAMDALGTASDLVGYGPYLDRVPPNPRQRRHRSDNRVEAERAAFALDLARGGSRVAVVSSGDPGVFAMAAAVLEVACEPAWKDVPVRVLPGLTAAAAVASRVGAPLGHDFCVLSLSDRLKPWEVIARRLTAAAAADLVIAVYNPASRSRTWQVEAARDLLLEHRAPDTPVVLGRDVGGAGERIRVVRLAELDPATVDMRTLLLIGSSRTRLAERGGGEQVVFTPRNYPG